MATFKFRAWVFDVFSVQHNDDICDFRKLSGFSGITLPLTIYRKITSGEHEENVAAIIFA